MWSARRLRSCAAGRLRALVLALVLVTLTGCGGGAPSEPTAGPAAPAESPAAVPSPAQRPALASPVASPSPSTAPGSAASATGASQSYTVKDGDTLLKIAEKFYGDGTLWRRIYDANKDSIGENPDALKVGSKLSIPPKP